MANPKHELDGSPRLDPPRDVSEGVLRAIQGALAEERRPRSYRIVAVAASTVASTLLLTFPIAWLFRDQMDWAWKLAALVWALCFAVGFSLYFHPQPRLSVPGYWSPGIFARILIVMTLMTGVQIVLCPSFVFLESPISWSPLTQLTDWFMSWGGMKGCMFSCGLLFSGIGGLLTFLSVRKVLSRSSSGDLLRAGGLAYLTQLPLVGVQVAEPGLQSFVPFWALGSVLGVLAMAVLAKRVGKR